MSKNNWRIILTAVLFLVACYAFWGTFQLWTMSDADKIALQEKDPGGLTRMQQKAIRLGLDLQGGIHVVLKVHNEGKDLDGQSEDVERAIQVIRNRIDGLGVAEPVILKQGTDRILIDLPGYTDADRAEELIGQTAQLTFKLLESAENANLLISKIDSVVHQKELANKNDDNSEEKASEPETVASTDTADNTTSDDDMLADLMGDDTTGEDKFAFDETTDLSLNDRPFSSRLETALYNNTTNTNWPGFAVNKKDKELLDKWINLPEVKRLIPEDVTFAWSTRSELRNNREVQYLYLLKRKVQFIGKYLENINMNRDSFGKSVVNFKLSGEGSARFAQLTGANINNPLAIVLDDRVESAPMINSKIRGSGQITMGSSASLKDARNMEIVLKAGALPVPVEIIEKNIVGASLGADSIKKGFYSSMVGLLIVLLYIAVYYRISGVIADIGLIFNIFFLMAIMAGLGATLTMPGIAGIILTIGISIDANILIFERIREELRTGKTVRASIDAGYERAFVAIIDSHITTLITAGALFLLGSGPIKGFAVTLFWGVLISLYTAYIITKQIFDIRKGYQKLSI